jgi:ferritin-like metal-binding protein YciE
VADPKYRLLEWLRDAHAMEQQAETMLSAMSRRIENYPELKRKIDSHLEETRQQSKRLDARLDQLGGRSALKDAAATIVGLGQGLSGLFVGDEVVKGAMASYTFEHFEISSYKVLIATAQQAGDDTTRRLCEEILAEEQAMADWLDDHLEQITVAYLERDRQEGVTAKH